MWPRTIKMLCSATPPDSAMPEFKRVQIGQLELCYQESGDGDRPLLLPDLPMFGFSVYHRLLSGISEERIWSRLCSQSNWRLLSPLAILDGANIWGFRRLPMQCLRKASYRSKG